MLTPYQFASNTPICAIDLDGLEAYYSIYGDYIGKHGTSNEIRVIHNREVIQTAKENLSHPDWEHDWLTASRHSQKAYTKPDRAAFEWGYVNGSRSDALRVDYNSRDNPVVARRELGSMIAHKEVKNEKGETLKLYILGDVVSGGEAGVDLGLSVTLEGWIRSDGIHTHVDSDVFSDGRNKDEKSNDATSSIGGDKSFAKAYGINLYLVTPKGALKVYDPVADKERDVTQGIPRGKYRLVKTGEKIRSRGAGCKAIYKDRFRIEYDQEQPPENMPSPK